MDDGENYIMRNVFSSSSEGVLKEQDLCNSQGVDKLILKWILKNQCVCGLDPAVSGQLKIYRLQRICCPGVILSAFKKYFFPCGVG
jgi:hypothetical protein